MALKTTLLELRNEEILYPLLAPETREAELRLLDRIGEDPTYAANLRASIQKGDERTGSYFLDNRMTLMALTRLIQPESFLEIGVRTGLSMAGVASEAPGIQIVGFDLWLDTYAGMANPGADFVLRQLQKVGHHGRTQLIQGDSRVTVPAYLKDDRSIFTQLQAGWIGPRETYDLVSVDGDHSLEGAWQDLENVAGRISVGGALVFDDIAPDYPTESLFRTGLYGIWTAFRRLHPRFRCLEYIDGAPGVGIAIRTS